MVTMEEAVRICNLCKQEKPLDEFYKNKLNSSGCDYKCKECRNKLHHEWYKQHVIKNPHIYEHLKASSKRTHASNVEKVLDHYGRECECCGETEPKFLTVDHIEPIGSYKKRIEAGHNRMYSWLVRNGFPSGYRLLCSNCNHGRARNGGICPHQSGSQARAQARSRKRGEVPDALFQQGKDMVEASAKAEAVPFGTWSDNPVWPFTPMSERAQ